MHISLIVIRCKELEASKIFYERIGLEFVEEQHGDGPVHYSATLNGAVLELYPNNGKAPNDNVRLGFTVTSIQEALDAHELIDSYDGDIGKVYVVQDPDGRKVELNE